MEQQYTIELAPDVLPFSPEQLAGASDEPRALIEEQIVFCDAHPVNTILRIATDGNLTSDGGIARTTGTGYQLMLDDGCYANVAQAGDEVVYPNEQTAKVANSAGEAGVIGGTGVAQTNRDCTVHVGLDRGETFTGAFCIAARPGMSITGKLKLYIVDKASPRPKCGGSGVMVSSNHRHSNSVAAAVAGSAIRYGFPAGTHYLAAQGVASMSDNPV